MFWLQHRKTKQLYKVYGWRETYGSALEYYVWVDDHWTWISSFYLEPTDPALHVCNIVPDDLDKKFTHYYVGDNI